MPSPARRATAVPADRIAPVRSVRRWGVLQWRRVAWVVQDVRVCLGALRRIFLSGPAESEPRIAIGVLEGQVRALVGRLNVYRVRLVNDAPDPIAVVLRLRGEMDAGRGMETSVEQTLPARGARELFLITDWIERFEMSPGPPATEGLEFLAGSRQVGHCRLAAALEAGGMCLDRLAIRQALG